MNKKTRKLFTWCLVVAMLVTQMLFANVAFAATKLSGTDRYQTALQVVKAGWTTSDNAVIARGDDLADALAAAPLAYAKGKAPILLTETAALPAGVMDELVALGVKNVYIVGGTGAVSQAVQDALAAKFTVKRLSGADRFATSLAVANEAFPTAPTGAVIVNGYAVADALSVSAIAAYKGMPILLVDKDTKTADVATYLAGKTLYAVGGEGVISAANAGTATRLAGADRYATNVAVLNAFTLDYSKVYVALGEDANAVDALGGAALAAKGNNPIVLVNGALTTGATALLKDKVKGDTAVYTLGGLVPGSVATAIEDIINGLELTVKSVSLVNSKEIAVTFNRAADDITAGDVANYAIKVNNATYEDFEVTVDEDDASKVTITLGDTLVNGDVVKVTVKKAIMDEDLKAMTADYTVTLPAFSDTAAPAIVSAEVDGATVVVTFNDYIEATASTLVKVDGLSYAAEGGYAIDGKTLTINVDDAAVAEGTHKVTLFGISDLVGNVSAGLTKSYTVTDDTTEPAFKSIEAKSTYVFAVTFNKNLAGAPTVTAKKNGYAVTVVSVEAGSSNSVWNVTVDDGTVPVYDDDATSATLSATISNIKDANDNYGAPVTKSVTLTQDTTAPTVDLRNTKIDGDNMLIQFSEALDPDAVDASSMIITNGEGVRFPADAFVASVVDDERYGDGTVLQLAFGEGALAADKYTVVLQADAVADLAGNGNAAKTVTLTKAAAAGEEDFALGGAEADASNVITVDFAGHDMTTSATNVNNYQLDYEKLPTGTIAYFLGDTSTVVIELPAGSVKTSSDYLLTLSKTIVDEDGLYVNDDTRNAVVTLTDNVKPTLLSAKKVDANTIELTFDEAMDQGDVLADCADDFVVKVNGADLGVTGVSAGSTTKKLLLDVDGYNLNQTVTVTVGGTGITLNAADLAGNVVTKGTTVTATK